MGRKFKRMSLEEREYISILLAKGGSLRSIGKELGRNHSSISRELNINAPPIHKGYYLAHKAHDRSVVRNRESHQRPRLKDETTRDFVCEKIVEGWSPELIAGRIREYHPEHKIGYEAIYQYIYAEGRDLIPCLARKHKQRKNRGYTRKHAQSHIPERVPLSERPEIVNSRQRFGDWEADTVVSRASKSALLVLSERKSRAIMITKLFRKTAAKVRLAAVRRLKEMPDDLRLTLTYDNGPENVEHQAINRELGTQSFFCAPYHSWEKGTVENSIGLIRRYFPKKTNFAEVSYYEVGSVERRLNNRPRKCLNYATPSEVLSGAIAGGM